MVGRGDAIPYCKLEKGDRKWMQTGGQRTTGKKRTHERLPRYFKVKLEKQDLEGGHLEKKEEGSGYNRPEMGHRRRHEKKGKTRSWE